MQQGVHILSVWPVPSCLRTRSSQHPGRSLTNFDPSQWKTPVCLLTFLTPNVFSHQAVLHFLVDTNWVSSSLIQFWYWPPELAQTPHVEDLVPQDCPTHMRCQRQDLPYF